MEYGGRFLVLSGARKTSPAVNKNEFGDRKCLAVTPLQATAAAKFRIAAIFFTSALMFRSLPRLIEAESARALNALCCRQHVRLVEPVMSGCFQSGSHILCCRVSWCRAIFQAYTVCLALFTRHRSSISL